MKTLSDIGARARRFAADHCLDGLVVLAAVGVGLLAFWAVASSAPLDVGPARLDISVRPSMAARTVVHVPPFGTVSATTHKGPVELRVRIDEIDVEGTRALISDSSLPTSGVLSGRMPPQLPVRRLPQAIARILGGGLFAALAAAALVAFAARRSRLVVAVACGMTLLAIALPLSVAASTWDVTAFKEPTLRGGLSYAPGLVEIFSTRVANIEKLRGQAEKVARDLSSYYADERAIGAGGSMAGTYRVLHITDQHLDPVGAELAAELARSYGVSLVIDTGDISIFGAEIEGQAIESLVATSVPRVFVPGNHDSQVTVDVMRAIPGVTVVETGTVEVDGLRIFGVADPFSRGFGLEPEPTAIADATLVAFERFSAGLRSGEATPDIVAIHNPAMEKPFIGQVPLILSGHTHAARAYRSQGTLRLNSGTLGGMPYDPATSGRKVVPYGASVLYYTSAVPRRLLAVDEIAVFSDRSTTVRRTVFDDPVIP
jgi:predicted phosphodiesterase